MSLWEASSLNNQVPGLLDLEKGQATVDRAQASKEEPDLRMRGSRRRWCLGLVSLGKQVHVHALLVGVEVHAAMLEGNLGTWRKALLKSL